MMTASTANRGNKAADRDPMMGFRAAPVLRASIVKWAEEQPDRPSLPEATRRLVELGLAAQPSDHGAMARRARKMAGDAIDEMNYDTASADDQASRKRRLLKGPEEFREVRVDRRTAKGGQGPVR
jgi:hypothetical protein